MKFIYFLKFTEMHFRKATRNEIYLSSCSSQTTPLGFFNGGFFSETAACDEKHEFKLVKKGVRLSSGKLR